MSGGVDSSMAAILLKNRGYDTSGVFLNLGQVNYKNAFHSAKKVAQKIGIPLKIIDLRKQFKKEIIAYFLKGYKEGITPNPCVKCNKDIKFGLLLKWAEKWKYDYFSTGHYIKKSKIKSQKSKIIYKLFQARDKTKDQSYFLYNLTQKQLVKLLFPLGNYTKEEVRKMADDWRLPYLRKESQDICFLDCEHNEYLKKHLKLKNDLPLYTIGQRHGFSRGGGVPYYVVAKNIKKNLLIVASKADESKFYKKEVEIKNMNWISGKAPNLDIKCPLGHLMSKLYKARIRYRQPLQSCRIVAVKPPSGGFTAKFTKPQRAVTPGQSLVLYRGNELLGGGIIVI